MSSKALLLPSVTPKLISQYKCGRRFIEVWTTTCIVSRFGKTSTETNCSVLINPSNPELAGCKNFPYFPRGGPVPAQVESMHKDWQPLGFVSQWGGMEIGSGMLFPASVVDGLVHRLGGWTLQAELQMKRLRRKQPCPVGSALMTSAGKGELNNHYDWIIHTTPPFYEHDEKPLNLLHQCYDTALQLAFSQEELRVAIPLLGAGARGFPTQVAVDVASKAAVDWICGGDDEDAVDDKKQTIVFGLLERHHANDLSTMIQHLLEKEIK